MGKERASGLAALSLVRFRYICVLDRRDHPELDVDTLEWQGRNTQLSDSEMKRVSQPDNVAAHSLLAQGEPIG
jgi:hypothetical protein